MQYQVFKKDSGEVVAWIDTETNEQVLHKDYDIKARREFNSSRK